MLRYGYAIKNLSKITRKPCLSYEQIPLKYIGIISASRNYSDAGDKKPGNPNRPPGTTLKAEECIPSNQSKSKGSFSSDPVCPIDPNVECPLSPNRDCGKRPVPFEEDGNRKKQQRVWMQLLTALFLTGATMYMVNRMGWLQTSETLQIPKQKKKKKAERKKVKIPAVSSEIVTEIPYLLIGGGTAAFSAFRSIKSRDPTAKVLVVTEEGDLPYMRPPLSKELWYNKDRETTEKLKFKQWNGSDRSLFYEPPEFYTPVPELAQSHKGGIGVALGWKVSQIDVVNRTAVLEDGHKIKYEKCLLATGASPKNLPIFETADDAIKSKIVPFRTIEDFLKLEESIRDSAVQNIVIVGGGFLGSEVACSLVRNLNPDQKKVHQIFKEKYIMAQVLPEYLSEWTTTKAMLEGVRCMPETEVADVEMKGGHLKLILTDGSKIDADQVIVAVGAQANTQLAQSSNLEIDAKVGGYLVNAELEARSDLWVAGDAACFYDVRLGRRRVEHHDHAVISGRLAGENMTGAGKPYLHQSMFWSDLGPEIGYEAIGIVDASLPTVGVFAKATDQDTPLAAVTASNEGLRSVSEEHNSQGNKSAAIIQATPVSQKHAPVEGLKSAESTKNVKSDKKDSKLCEDKGENKVENPRDDFGKGVIFYLRDDVVVGIVLWNIFNRMSIARQVLASGTRYDDLNEVAKLFSIHED
ncbi:apoptosis-inducing factor 1, mitochondrial [Neodiprion fabricii]|uniref:apoptosis-inducing factor 1, mitochondrial n=1 Tax=Neodiprion fabricii TaxID=2872261 RepID=UPI001ED8F397|nr:apoptosis-inducing factor 1, mitochondrial [Neodiprion fabricii]